MEKISDTYFPERYKYLNYPRESQKNHGLRNAQIGAIHSISSFFTISNSNAAIIVMPTGSGKTAVLMMTPYVLEAKKVLVVTPSKMVRGQITEDFSQLKTLIKANVFNDKLLKPNVYEMKHLLSEDMIDDIESVQVIIATPACALSLTKDTNINKEIDLVLIDEAHHVPAKTWQQILINMKHARQILFTATPFRMDNREIKGEIIYNYPLSLAYKEGIFGEVQYIPIEEYFEKDKLIAKKAEEVFLLDREKGLDHYLMVRTNSKKHAKELERLYSDNTTLKLKRVDSSMANSTVMKCIKDLRGKKLDGIICVDMLGEGFDFPNLKIAAIHAPHKSLASTLQFIGRFARTNAENIGAAKFIAMNDSELIIENQALYTSDSVWQDMIIDMSESKISEEESIKEYIGDYHNVNENRVEKIDDFSLHGVRLNCHAKIYKAFGFNSSAKFPDACKIEYGPFLNEKDNTIVAIGKDHTSPKWFIGEGVKDVENLLYLVHYQRETNLLFIYSQIKSEIVYEGIANSFCSYYEKIPKHEMNRVLGNLREFEIFNSGMQNRYNDSGESYRISAGVDVSQSIDPSTGKLYSAGHVFCKALTDESEITIGYSSGSKMWSSTYASIRDYIKWCDYNGSKISNSGIVVKTNTNYDYLPVPSRLVSYPSNIFISDFSWKTYVNPPTIYFSDNKEVQGILLDVSIRILNVKADEVRLLLKVDDTEEVIVCDVNSNYSSDSNKILVSDGHKQIKLSEYLNNHPLVFRTTDDVMITGIEQSEGNPDAMVFSNDNIVPIDWIEEYGTDIKVEVNDPRYHPDEKSIQTSLREILLTDSTLKYIIYDHSKGEIADYITVLENKTSYEITLFHVKKMSAANYNSDVNDIYEVAGQAIKSIIWLKTKSILLKKIEERRKSKHCIFIRGDYDEFKKELRSQDKQIIGKVVIVQPSISKDTYMPDKIQEVLAATKYYISNSGKVKQLEIWGSK
ncbi:DEAD/DEAH box helicase [Oceanobacillus salinisoli]|uniref:DEAD/DEAH box helicase n=1 Tax=Oceanobacillus salinisoli TaxID=2678611 RepID=UPI0012E32A87|nr:DEAD/DEAH box helicase family protein [Oceanobacillus salinisoli]